MPKKRKMIIHKRAAAPPAGRKTCVDLFSGAGGLAVGFREAGWAVLAGNDADEDAAATFRLNFPEAVFFEGPISAVTAPSILNECGLRRGELDCLIGGPPCQSFSYNNHQRSAEDERAQLFKHYIRLIKGLRPKTLIMENVPGILTIGDNAVIGEISRKLTGLGYDVEVKILSAEEFGTPQVRKRVFIAASSVGAAAHMLPAPSHQSVRALRTSDGNPKSQRTAVKNAVTVQDAIGDLPALASGGGKQVMNRGSKKATSSFQIKARKGSEALHNHICHALTEKMLVRVAHVPEGGNWRDIPFNLLPAGMQRARAQDHTKRYGRLARKGLASTILTKCDPHWGAYLHPTQQRTLSVREAARLQGFPDTFVFAGTRLSKQYMQVGNAVPVPVAEALAKAALLQFAN